MESEHLSLIQAIAKRLPFCLCGAKAAVAEKCELRAKRVSDKQERREEKKTQTQNLLYIYISLSTNVDFATE